MINEMFIKNIINVLIGFGKL